MSKKKIERDTERLHVRIAHSGLCSRRAAEQLIQEGRVQVNGDFVREFGVQVADHDEVRVDGQVITEAKVYTLVMNKPVGVVTTLFDPQGRQTIAKYLPDYGVQLKPVGRLDMDTDGLLIVTNDGDLALRLAHPRYGIEKEYQAIVQGVPTDNALERLARGVFVEGRKTAPALIEVVHVEERKQTTSLRLTIHEGRKRQVRLMCLTVGHPVIKLTRIRLGPLYLRGMRPGEVRLLGQKEVDQLRAMVGLSVPEDRTAVERGRGDRVPTERAYEEPEYTPYERQSREEEDVTDEAPEIEVPNAEDPAAEVPSAEAATPVVTETTIGEASTTEALNGESPTPEVPLSETPPTDPETDRAQPM